MGELSKLEYEGLMQLAQAALEAERSDEWWLVVSELTLGPLFHADVFALAELNQRTRSGQFRLIRPTWAEFAVPTGSEMHADLVERHPLTGHLAGPAGLEVVKVTDLVSPLAWRQMAGHAKMQELISATNQLSVPIAVNPESNLSMSPIRSGVDFTEHEILVAKRLQPLLQAAERHVRFTLELRETLGADARAAADHAAVDLRLTARERVVLGIMADGLSTVAIARKLSVSPRTVGKHQENLYRKLGVSDRLSAILRAQHVGLVERPEPADAERASSSRIYR